MSHINVCKYNDYIDPDNEDFWYKIPKSIRENMNCICSKCVFDYGHTHCRKRKKALWIVISPESQDFGKFKKFIEDKMKSKYIDSYWYCFEWRVKEIKFIGDKPLILPRGLHCHIFLYYNDRYARQHFKSNRNKNFKMISKIYTRPPISCGGIHNWESECREYCKWDGIHKIKKSDDWILKKKNDILIRKFYNVSHFINSDGV